MDLATAELEDVLGRVELFDLEVELVDGELILRDSHTSVVLPIHRRSSVTPSAASRLVDDNDRAGLVIGDLIHSQARDWLGAAGWSFWDRRGMLLLFVPELRLNIERRTPQYVTGADGPDPMQPVAGGGGLAVGLAALLAPSDPPGVREVGRMAALAPSTISRARSRLTAANLLEADGRPLVPELFWSMSDAWAVDWVDVDRQPEGPGWIPAGDSVAALWGAPTLAADNRAYATDPQSFLRHRTAHGVERRAGVMQIALQPTPLVSTSAVDRGVHPVVAALDLSRDVRGREILGDWTSIVQTGLPQGAVAEVVWQ